MLILFNELPRNMRKGEFENSQGILSGYIYELFKERILSINSNFRKWRKETNNENNIQINVRHLFNKLFFYSIIGQFLEI